MQKPNLYHIFLCRLNRLSARYMVTGAAASIIYGEPRMTNDIDLVVDLNSDEIERFCDEFPLDEFYCPPIEVIALEVNRPQRGHFNLIHHETGFKADIYAAGSDELHRWGLANRKQIQVEGEECWLAPVEYVILRKLEYFREGGSEKHLRDVSGILCVSSDHIDFSLLKERVAKMMLQKEWAAAQEYKFRS